MSAIEKRAVFTGAFGLLLFACVAYAALSGAAAGFDTAARQYVHGWASPLGAHVMMAVTQTGGELLMVPLGMFLFLRMRSAGHRRDAVLFAVVTLGTELLTQVLKLLFHRHRPEPFFGLPVPETYSFPSGHAFIATVYYLALAILMTRNPTIRTGAVALVCLIGLSRIYLGLHYPSDVLGGYLLAIVSLSGLVLARSRYRRMPV